MLLSVLLKAVVNGLDNFDETLIEVTIINAIRSLDASDTLIGSLIPIGRAHGITGRASNGRASHSIFYLYDERRATRGSFSFWIQTEMTRRKWSG
jgi:hypothetical protein